MIDFKINALSKRLTSQLQTKIHHKTKPPGALGILEELALQIGLIQNSLTPQLNRPTIIVFSADHGIHEADINAYPQEVTHQMVENFLNGGAAINIFCKQNKIDIKVVDAGINFDFNPHPNLIDAKIAKGTQNYFHTPAMTTDQCMQAFFKGREILQGVYNSGCNIIGFGEMGICNTSSAALMMSLLCDIPLNSCVGRGTGLDDEGLDRKKEILSQALQTHLIDRSVLSVLSTFGGFEIAMMCGAMLQAAQQQMTVMIDGFITTAALLAAVKINANILDYCIFSHLSDEVGHRMMLEYLKARPLLNLGMRLGEGTGVALAYPLIQTAVNFLNEMASFEKAGVSNQERLTSG